MMENVSSQPIDEKIKIENGRKNFIKFENENK